MGWSWAGASEWLSEKKLEEREREKWEQARKDKLVSVVLPQLLKRREAQIAEAKAARATMSTAVRKFGLDEAAAAVLYSTGELEDIMPILEENYKKGSVNVRAMKTISDRVLQDVPPEKIAGALRYANKIGFMDGPSVEKYVETLYNVESADEVVDTAAMLSAQGAQEARPDIPAFGLNPAGLATIDEKRRKSIQSTITEQLSTQLGLTSREISPTGETLYQFENPSAAGRIINNAVEYYVNELQNSVFSNKSPEEIQSEIYTQFQDAQDMELNLEEISTLKFGEGFYDNLEVAKTTTPLTPLPTGSNTGEPIVDLMPSSADPMAGEDKDDDESLIDEVYVE